MKLLPKTVSVLALALAIGGSALAQEYVKGAGDACARFHKKVINPGNTIARWLPMPKCDQ